MNPTLAAVGLAVAFALPLLGFYCRRTAAGSFDWPRLRRTLVRNWVVILSVGAVGVVAGPGSLGLRVPAVGVLVDGTLFGFVAFAGTMLAVGLLARRLDAVEADPATLAVLDQPAHRRLAVAVTGAGFESLLYYGFAVEAALDLGAGPVVAGAAAVAGVLLVRAQWGAGNALQWLPGAVVLAGIALWSRTVLPVLLVRLVYDAVTVVAGDAGEEATATDA